MQLVLIQVCYGPSESRESDLSSTTLSAILKNVPPWPPHLGCDLRRLSAANVRSWASGLRAIAPDLRLGVLCWFIINCDACLFADRNDLPRQHLAPGSQFASLYCSTRVASVPPRLCPDMLVGCSKHALNVYTHLALCSPASTVRKTFMQLFGTRYLLRSLYLLVGKCCV